MKIKLTAMVMPAPMSVIYAPAVVLRVNRYQMERLMYIPRNMFASNRIGTTFSPAHIFSSRIKYFQISRYKETIRNMPQIVITKNFITRAYTFGALASVDCLKKKGS